ncbi:MAG: hypothetical protein HOQ07_06750, partial [Sinomonas sp.]|nr:hypothetical protein [Sinomonas sp.]
MKRHAAAVIAITFILAEAAATARADISKGPNGGGSSSDTCAFGALTVSRGGGGTDVTTSISCSETSTKTTSGKISGSDWTPPKCWWEEITQDKFMKDYMNFSAMLHRTGTDRDDPEYVSKFHAYYKNFHDGDPGNWLQGYCEADATPDDYTTLGWDNLPGLWVWSPPGVPSPVGTAPTVTTETLAEIAAGKMPIPNTKISMSPSQPNDPTLPAGTASIRVLTMSCAP